MKPFRSYATCPFGLMLLASGMVLSSTPFAWAHPGHGSISSDQEPVAHYLLEPIHGWGIGMVGVVLSVALTYWIRRGRVTVAGGTNRSDG